MKAGPGRPKGSLNVVTRDIRAALRDLAENNSESVQDWIERVAVDDPGEATRLFLELCRFVTPTLKAATVADLSPPTSAKTIQQKLYAMTDAELLESIFADDRAALRAPAAAHLIGPPADHSDDPLFK